MINQYRDGYIPAKTEVEPHRYYPARAGVLRRFRLLTSARRDLVGHLVARRIIVQQQPWKLAKSQAEGAQDQLDGVLYTAAEYIRVITALVSPVLPETAVKIWRMLGMQTPVADTPFIDLAEQSLEPGRRLSRSHVVPANRSDSGHREDAGTRDRRDSATICAVREGDPERGADRIDDRAESQRR